MNFIRGCSGIASSSALNNFCHDLKRRGLIAFSQPENLLDCHKSGKSEVEKLPNVLYAGFDPTNDSLHIGNLLILTALFRSSLKGCRPIALIGGATAMIGDPSGRTEDRPELLEDVVVRNADRLIKQLVSLWQNVKNNYEFRQELIVENNLEWYKDISMIDFLRLARSFRIADMVRMGHIKSRLSDNQGLSYTEFSYQILQSYDWYHLSKKYNCYFQIGGSDQLGHIHSGYDYIKKRSKNLSGGICLPLVTSSDGRKLGKSTTTAESPVWLDKEKTSPFAFYQYFMQLHDDTAARLMVYFSLRCYEEIESILAKHHSNLGKRIAQAELATEMTRLVHGYEGLVLAEKCSKIIFEGSIYDFKSLNPIDVELLFGSSIFCLRRDSISSSADLANATRKDNLEVLSQMKAGAFKVNGKPLTDPNMPINVDDMILNRNLSLISWGKRRFFLVKWL